MEKQRNGTGTSGSSHQRHLFHQLILGKQNKNPLNIHWLIKLAFPCSSGLLHYEEDSKELKRTSLWEYIGLSIAAILESIGCVTSHNIPNILKSYVMTLEGNHGDAQIWLKLQETLKKMFAALHNIIPINF